MKITKRILAALLAMITVVLCFSGCSKSESADEITAETMLIAYTEEKAPFLYEENGELKGFDVELFETIFDNIKNDYKNYKFVKVDEDYRLGEEAYCVDASGKECIAYIMVGGIQKNVDDINERFTFTADVINNRVLTITKDGYGVTDYTALNGKEVGTVGDTAKAGLDKHAVIKNGCASVTEYSADRLADAVADLESGKIKAIVVDEFTYCASDVNADSYITLDGELEKESYVYALRKFDWFDEAINNAIYELRSPDYNDSDDFTPIVEKYFGYNASSFSYEP